MTITNYDSFLTVTRNYEKCAETGINVRVERGVGMFLLDVTNGVSGTWNLNYLFNFLHYPNIWS